MGDAWNSSMKLLSAADRAHALLSKGYNVVQDRLEPEVRQVVGSALQTYGRRSRQTNNLDTNVKEIGRQLRQSFPEYLQ